MANVALSKDTLDDLFTIYQFIRENDGDDHAKAIIKRLKKRMQSLETLPLRGKLPEELAPFGNTKIREIQETPWRIFYIAEDNNVTIMTILDSRRALEDLMFERLSK